MENTTKHYHVRQGLAIKLKHMLENEMGIFLRAAEIMQYIPDEALETLVRIRELKDRCDDIVFWNSPNRLIARMNLIRKVHERERQQAINYGWDTDRIDKEYRERYEAVQHQLKKVCKNQIQFN